MTRKGDSKGKTLKQVYDSNDKPYKNVMEQIVRTSY